jgi:hypothetical protein
MQIGFVQAGVGGGDIRGGKAGVNGPCGGAQLVSGLQCLQDVARKRARVRPVYMIADQDCF